MLLFSTDKNKEVKPKRKRIAPIHTTTVEYRIKQKQAELGLSKHELVWLAIQNELAQLDKANK